MTSQVVQGTWLNKGGYGQFRGQCVNDLIYEVRASYIFSLHSNRIILFCEWLLNSARLVFSTVLTLFWATSLCAGFNLVKYLLSVLPIVYT